MHAVTLLFSSGALVALGAFIPRRRHRIEECETLTERLTPEARNGLSKYIQADDMDGETFWEESHGLAGINSRLRDLWLMLRILQCGVHDELVTPADARVVLRLASLQCYYSLWAYPETLLCRVWRSNPHLCAAAALRFHWGAYLRTLTLCKVNGAPDCIFGLR